MINWVSLAWESVTSEVIRRSCKAMGISPATDGSEDDQLTGRKADGLNAAERDDFTRGMEATHLLFDDGGSDSDLKFGDDE